MACGSALSVPGDAVSARTAARGFGNPAGPPGRDEWPALLRRLDRIDPGWRDRAAGAGRRAPPPRQPRCRPKNRKLRSQAICAQAASYCVIGSRAGPTAVSLANACWAR